MKAGRGITLLGALCAVAACSSPWPGAQVSEPFEVVDHPGVWRSVGYGYVLHLDDLGSRVFHVTGTLCVEDKSSPSLVHFFNRVQFGKDRQTLLLSSDLDPYPYEFRRAPSLPAPCLAPVADTPETNFEAFAAYFAEHYAFFDLYGVDWADRTARVRASIDAETSDRALFDSLSELARPLKDSHIKIKAEIDGDDVVYDGNPGKTERAIVDWARRSEIPVNEAVGRFRRNHWFAGVRDSLLDGKGVIAGNGRIQYGMAAQGVGYIAFVSMGGFVDGELDSHYEEIPALSAAMDDALALFDEQGARSVLVDLSVNSGGYDFIGLAIAGRFAAERRLAFTRRAGDDPDATDFPLYVEPASGARFTGPVYLLTSDLTVSAAEIMTLGLRALDNVTHVGETTRGAFSTVLKKYLPNGWELSLSNEVYTDPQGEVWEGRGMEPEIPIRVFDPDNPLEGHLDAVAKVIDLIGGHN